MTQEVQAVLTYAIGRSLPTVLSLPSAGMLRHHKSRFLDENNDGIWIASAPPDHALIDELIHRANPAAISFKLGVTKTSFAATPLKREAEFKLNATTTTEALLLKRPAEIKTVQRRHNYRARVHEDSQLTARLWRIGEMADPGARPLPQQEVRIQLRDLSHGGIGITALSTPAEPARLVNEERVRIELRFDGQTLVLEGRVRHLDALDNAGVAVAPAIGTTTTVDAAANPTTKPKACHLRAGIQFKKLEEDLKGRHTLAALTRIVGLLQRQEARRARLALTRPA